MAGRLLRLLAIGTVGAIALLPGRVLADGVGVTPTEIDLGTLPAGGSAVRSVTVLASTPLEVDVTGDIGPWVTIDNRPPPAEVVPGMRGQLTVRLAVGIPASAAPGPRTGALVIRSPGEVGAEVAVPIALEVAAGDDRGAEIVAVTLPATAEIGRTHAVSLRVRNLGSTQELPRTTLVATRGDHVVATVSATHPELEAGSAADLVTTWQPIGTTADAVDVWVEVRFGELAVATVAGDVQLVPPGTGRRIVTPTGISVADRPAVDAPTRLAATYRYDGDVPATIQFVGQASHDGAGLGEVTSIAIAADPGDDGAVDVFVPAVGPGAYELEGRWLVDGSDGPVDGAAWRIDGRLPPALVVAGFGVVGLTALAGARALGRRR